jgi:hypothetical protein
VELLLIVVALLLLDLAAMRWGADSRDLRPERPERPDNVNFDR